MTHDLSSAGQLATEALNDDLSTSGHLATESRTADLVNSGHLVFEALNGRPPVLVVDLDDRRSLFGRRLPVTFPALVVGVSRSGWPSNGTRGYGTDTADDTDNHDTDTANDTADGTDNHDTDNHDTAGTDNNDDSSDALSTVDIVLVPESAVPPGRRRSVEWVAVADIDLEVSRLREAASRAPIASVALMQVLRAGSVASLEHDLLVESLTYSMLQGGAEHAAWLSARPARKRRPGDEGLAVLLERDGGRLTVTLNRPRVRNAYNVAVREGLCDAFELVALDPSIESVRLRGTGSHFCSGGDLEEFGTGPGPAESHLIRTTRAPALRLARVAERVTVELHGACVGAGIEIPALAGHVVAAPDTRIRLPEVAMGLIPGAGGTSSVRRRIGRHRTAWLALGGAWLDALTALEWGLVDEVR